MFFRFLSKENFFHIYDPTSYRKHKSIFDFSFANVVSCSTDIFNSIKKANRNSYRLYLPARNYRD